MIARLLPGLLLALAASPALADPISVTKSVTIISDPVGSAVPRSVPGAVADYHIVLANPLANAGSPVRNIAFEDAIPVTMVLRVSDLANGGSGPIVFTDGPAVLGIGNSGLTYSFGGLADTTDSVDFSDGTTWGYVPVPDADGYDARVRAIRIKPLTTFKTSGSFSLRFRVRLR